MSEYYLKQRAHLQKLLESFVSDEVDAYLYDSTDSAWGLIYYKPTNTLMSISYEGVNGIGLGSCLKPNKWHGTGYQCLEPGFRWITTDDLKEACHQATVLLTKGIMAERETRTPGICLPADMQNHMYRDMDEYFEARWPTNRNQFIRIEATETCQKRGG